MARLEVWPATTTRFSGPRPTRGSTRLAPGPAKFSGRPRWRMTKRATAQQPVRLSFTGKYSMGSLVAVGTGKNRVALSAHGTRLRERRHGNFRRSRAKDRSAAIPGDKFPTFCAAAGILGLLPRLIRG